MAINSHVPPEAKSPRAILGTENTMVTMVINELKSILDLTVF